jgi:outer membrane protein insertion porin family
MAGLVFFTGSTLSLRAQTPSVEGQHVTEVAVVDPSGQPVREKIPPLPLTAGKPFDFAAERASLRLLYQMGDYSNIQVDVKPREGGMRVEFIVRPNFYSNVIRINGLRPPPNEPAALAALRLPLGEPFRESALRAGIERLQDTLRDEGLYVAKITWQLVPNRETRQMDVVITIDSGTRARVGAISLDNKTPYPDQQILKRSKLSKKTEIDSQNLSRASDRLKKFLVDQGYLGASAHAAAGTYDPRTNLVPLKLSVSAGPRVRIEIEGARLSKSTMQRLLPMYIEGAVDEDLLQEGRRNIRDYFQSQGYFDADVQVRSSESTDGVRSIIYQVSRGDRFRLASVTFEGNKYFSDGLLAKRLTLQTASFANSGRFSQQLMRDDAESIRGLYLANGFRDAQVTTSVDDEYRGRKNNLQVAFHITEGVQSRIADLKIEGNQTISTQALLSVIGSTAGQPYSDSNVASDRNNVMALYYDQGYPEANFRETVSPSDKPNEFRLVYHITEGPRFEVKRVLITGYQYTRPGVIRRQVTIVAGGPLRESDTATTQRQLYNLGIFNRVQIAPQNPNGTDPQKTVVVAVQEGQRYTIGYGAGFEVQRIAGGSNPNGTTLGASPRGIFEITKNNVAGRAQTLTFRARASTLEYRFLLGYTANNFLTKKSLSLQITGFADKTQDVDTFTSTRFEGGLQLVQKLSPSSSLLYSYFYRRVRATNINKTINPEEIPLLSQPTLVSGFEITYARDRRDNPADAKRGTFNSLDVSDAIEAIGSSSDFVKVDFQNSSYYSFGRAFVFARAVRFGFEEPYGNTVEPSSPSCIPDPNTGDISCTTIPLPERLFAGGGTSLRGFSLNQAGPRDPVTGFPVGGLAMLIFNQELRFPMRLPIIGNRLGGTLFYDGGNVYTDINHISMAWKAPSLTNLNYFSHTVGFGVRYPTPIGPVRVDFGYQLNPAQYQATNTTTNLTQILRLPHFNFFFNIGPVF